MVTVNSALLSVGWEAISFKLPDVNGREWPLGNFAEYRGLLVVFMCNHCQYAKAAWPILASMHEEFGDDVGFIAINPNDESEYPEGGVGGMRKLVEEQGIEFPYVRDESQGVAHDYEAQCTPDPYLFLKNEDGEFELFYHGRINDNWQNEDEVEEHSLQEALEKLLSDEEPPREQMPSMGCSIKWR